MNMLLSELDQSLFEGINDPHIFKAVFIAGPPGAGKNTVINQLGLPSSGLKLQDIDHTLAYLNKRKSPVNPNYERGLSVTLRRQGVFEKGMLGLLINTTGRSYDRLMDLNKQLKHSGYDTFMVFVDAEYDVAYNRIQDRPSSATNPADIGRKVDYDYFVNAFQATKQNIDFYALMFGNDFSLVTNNVVKDSEDLTPEQEFNKTLTKTGKKLNHFLRKPLSPKAQAILNQATSTKP